MERLGTLPDILHDRPPVSGPPKPTNQVYTAKFDDNNPFAQRDYPNTEYVKQHRLVFEKALRCQEGDPPYYYGLPEGRYEILGASDHPGKRPVWRLSPTMVADGPGLIAALVPGDGMDLIPGQVYHSHWEGLKGGAVSHVVIVNTGEGSGAGGVGEGGRNVTLDAEIIGEMLASPVDDEKRLAWLKGIRHTLTVAA